MKSASVDTRGFARSSGPAAVLGFACFFLLAVTVAGQSYSVLTGFSIAPANPYASLVQGTDGNLYGTTAGGGTNGHGIIFKSDRDGAGFTVLHEFLPIEGRSPAGLIQGADGFLYGTSIGGGENGQGSVFKIDVNGGSFATLHSFSFTDGANPRTKLTQGSDGKLYGTTYQGGVAGLGTVFTIGTNGTGFATLHGFSGSDGENPDGELLQGTDGRLYGTAYLGGPGGYGTVFRLDTGGGAFTTLHGFSGSDGAGMVAGVIEGADGNLYGTTYGGGSNEHGTLFKIDPSGTLFETLHHFDRFETFGGIGGVIQTADGNLVLNTIPAKIRLWRIFKLDTSGSVLSALPGLETENPGAGLIEGTDGTLYGTTTVGGGAAPGNPFKGRLYKIDTDFTALPTLYTFLDLGGEAPQAGVIQGTDGNLYGTTSQGGDDGLGTIYRIDPTGQNLATLHSFHGVDGANPLAALVQASDGGLYGTTRAGGTSDNGTIFKIEMDGTGFTTLHSFAGSDGAEPVAGLIQGSDGFLYGDTQKGGGGRGTIFKIDTEGAALVTLHSFGDPTGGENPTGVLVQAPDGNLYGTTAFGGAHGFGTIFRIDINGNSFVTLHSFDYNNDGGTPRSGLTLGTDGNLYGTAVQGGSGGYGTLFKTDASGATLTVLHSFSHIDGSGPYAGLFQGTDGRLYGTTTHAGARGRGIVFRIDTDGRSFTTLHSFPFPSESEDGLAPLGTLIQGTDGAFYGTAAIGGIAQRGVVFRLVACETPTAVVSGTAAVCLGGPSTIQAALTGTSPWDLTWSDGFVQLGVASASAIRSVSPSTTTTYTVTDVADAMGSGTSSGSAVITVNPRPVAIATGTAAICQGSSTTLSGSGGVSCAWEPETGLSSASSCSPSASPAATTTYSLTVTGPDGCVSNNPAAITITVDPAPQQPVVAAPVSVAIGSAGRIVSVANHPGSTYAWTLSGGTISAGQPTHEIEIDAGEPGATMICTVVETAAGGCSSAMATTRIQVDFLDVLPSDPFHDAVVTAARNGIAVGCGGGQFCRDDPVRRDQMAVFLLKAKHGPSYLPPPTCAQFVDVPCSSTFSPWIEALVTEGITAGCGAETFCPLQPVTRQQMAVFLLKTRHGSSYVPPACSDVFSDVDCPSPFADWIEQLAAENVTGGCGGGSYCPTGANTRGQMAVFIVKAFNLF